MRSIRLFVVLLMLGTVTLAVSPSTAATSAAWPDSTGAATSNGSSAIGPEWPSYDWLVGPEELDGAKAQVVQYGAVAVTADGGAVFIASPAEGGTRRLVAVNGAGGVRWNVPLNAGCGPILVGNDVWALDNDADALVPYSLSSGTRDDSRQVSEVSATGLMPSCRDLQVVDDDTFAMGSQFGVAVIDSRAGTELWSARAADTGCQDEYSQFAVSADGGTIFALGASCEDSPPSGVVLLAFNAQSGSLLARLPMNGGYPANNHRHPVLTTGDGIVLSQAGSDTSPPRITRVRFAGGALSIVWTKDLPTSDDVDCAETLCGPTFGMAAGSTRLFWGGNGGVGVLDMGNGASVAEYIGGLSNQGLLVDGNDRVWLTGSNLHEGTTVTSIGPDGSRPVPREEGTRWGLSFGDKKHTTTMPAAIGPSGTLYIQSGNYLARLISKAPDGASRADSSAFDGDAATTHRIATSTPTDAAIEVSRLRWPDGNADHVVLSRDDAFPDSLAASGLLSRGPLLFTRTTSLTSGSATEIDRVLPSGGRIYLLGGPAAISSGVENDLRGRGYDVRRLAGDTRIQTALAVASEVRRLFPDETDVLVARSHGPGTAGWADSVTGGTYAARDGVPIVVTPTDSLHPDVKAWLNADQPGRSVILGGEAAIDWRVANELPNAYRVAGEDRAETAFKIGLEFFGVPNGQGKRVIVDGYRADGWAFGLVGAGLASDNGAPMLYVHPDLVPKWTVQSLGSCNDPASVDILLMGDASVISQARQADMDALDGRDDVC